MNKLDQLYKNRSAALDIIKRLYLKRERLEQSDKTPDKDKLIKFITIDYAMAKINVWYRLHYTCGLEHNINHPDIINGYRRKSAFWADYSDDDIKKIIKSDLDEENKEFDNYKIRMSTLSAYADDDYLKRIGNLFALADPDGPPDAKSYYIGLL